MKPQSVAPSFAADGPHAYDILDSSESSREVIRQIVAFLRFHLLAAPARS
ncbi:MAG: hypothetical protein ACXVI6_09300 [Candidatus Aminicenantales bacterium]